MAMQGIRFHTIDPTKIRGKRDFRCPKCQVEISPDDQTENAYNLRAGGERQLLEEADDTMQQVRDSYSTIGF
jgi:hypothetical protein